MDLEVIECDPSLLNPNGMDVDENLLNITIHRNSILDDVAHSDAFFKSQQRGEKDLTFDEKRSIAETLLDKNKVIFLQRYWRYVSSRDIAYFDSIASDYEVSYYLSEIKKNNDNRKSRAKIRNRRYEAMKKMMSDGSYFSDDEMRHRNPFLYDRLVGQHLTEKERADAKGKGCASFSGFLMEQIDRNFVNGLSKMQEEAEEPFVEENDEDTEEEEEELEEFEEEDFRTNPASTLSDSEKKMLRNEFMNTMYESFLLGNDKEFDYSSVDDNAEYDSIQEREVDEEEKYFDEDSSEPSAYKI